jgi:hypothetical protein
MLLALGAVLSLLLTNATGADEPVVRSQRTWRRVAELSLDEKALLDFRTETPRDPGIPYLPAEKYPFTAPFTAEEMGYRIMSFAHNARWPHTLADSFGAITKAGYLTENVSVVRVAEEVSETEGVPGQVHIAPGNVFMRFAFYYTYPPKFEHLQGLWSYRRTDKRQRTKVDIFIYIPSMRRVRRLPQPRRDGPIPDAVQSFDDIVGRDAWEFSWRVIGTDVLYETARFPETRPTMVLARADGSFFDISTAGLKLMGDTYPFYTADGGVECLVLVAKPKSDWLPSYAVSKIIYWIDRHYFFPLRIEQYDAEGKLKTVQVRLAKQENPALGPEGHTGLLTVYWDSLLDLISYSLHDAHRVIDWTEDEQSVMFSPDFMRRSWLKYAQPTQSLVGSPKEFYLRPSLEGGKFPEERRIRLKSDVETRIRAQNAAGHLVFATSDALKGQGDGAQ